MLIRWGKISQQGSNLLRHGWFLMAALIALYLGGIRPMGDFEVRETDKQSGPGAVAGGEPAYMWKQVSLSPSRLEQHHLQAYGIASPESQQPRSTDHKLVRTSSLDIVVQSPAGTSELIKQQVTAMGGVVTSSTITGETNAQYGTLSIRVPASNFEKAVAEIRRLAVSVETEKQDAQDVTKQFVDEEARLHNLRAQETQYLAILKRAKTIKETLDVTEKLDGVRGQIEEKQAEFQVLSQQVETVALNVSLHAESDIQVFGLNWRPVYQIKLALRSGLNGLADYATSMLSFLLYLPAILLWLTTLVAGAFCLWRGFRWTERTVFKKAVQSPSHPTQ